MTSEAYGEAYRSLHSLQDGFAGGWRDSYGIAFGTNVCYRCGAKLKDGAAYKVGPYVARFTMPRQGPATKFRFRIYHARDCNDA